MMLRTHLKPDLSSPLLVATFLGLIAVLARAAHNPTAGSVNLINAINDSVVVHCWSRESDLGQSNVFPGMNYYWSFHPNLFGRTVFKCNFLWMQVEQEFAVWQGTYHPNRPPCCDRGPCSYKICPDGFYNAFIVDTDYGVAESWEFYVGWLPRFSAQGKIDEEGS
ncbi:hypothetical protein M758_12G182100 [Ceratodon purpureus]|uniref:S-protein homolog n=1 Tax=Ceratodon purpureus TaxID=3225 RepID=A0A8T0GAS3_CERPU|nr:hypothetical protein KC19_12G178600 [Ceratodon purpureus]KAG0599836.1 hypothetical protein M758_12G182100 [Ceratodon purpureus]